MDKPFTVWADGQRPATFATKAEAIVWADQFEAAEVRDDRDNRQVWVKFPRAVFI